MERETPWLRAKKTKSQRQEERNGKMEGGSKQINSGRFWRSKRDNTLHSFLVESRTTDAGSYRIDKKEFLDIKRDGLQTPPGLLPSIQVDLGELHLMIVELSAFQDMAVRILELEALMERQSNGPD